MVIVVRNLSKLMIHYPSISSKIKDIYSDSSSFQDVNIIFKTGGRNTKECGIIFYSPKHLNDSSEFDLNYYPLPQHPFGYRMFSFPNYSNKYGLILITRNEKKSQIAFLNFKKDCNNWNAKPFPDKVNKNFLTQPNNVLINNGSAIFSVNGKLPGDDNHSKHTSIYDLATEEFKELADNDKDNDDKNCATAQSGIYFDEKYDGDKIYVGGTEMKDY